MSAQTSQWLTASCITLACLGALLSGSYAGAATGAAAGTTWYVRPDGGTPDQCTGQADAGYPGIGTGQPCAWDHPFRALPPGGPPRIAGGDTLIIGAGSYRMGLGASGADNPDVCDADFPWDCHMSPLPSGPDAAHPTRILGAGWDSRASPPPELWGTERAAMILNLTDASNIEVSWLEITDHAGCVEFHTGGLACERDAYPYGDWAAVGLYAEDATNVHLKDLNIHGLASTGVHAGRLTDWTVENVRIVGNGWVGWDGDIDGNDSNAGTLTFRRWTVAWNGCGETYPGGQPTGCWAQTAGGYGDGVGTGRTGGHWIIEDAAFLHNTSDGLDLLYAREPGASITIRRTIAEGNAGNQIKTNGPTHIENSIIVGNCGYFDGQSFTFNVDNCRAYGNALALNLQPGNQVTVVNNTLTGEGDCLVEVICEGTCDGSETVRMDNNILQGQADFVQSFENTCLAYRENFPSDPLDMDYSIITDVKENPCPVGPHDLCGAAGLANPAIDAFDAHLRSDSPAMDVGTPHNVPSDDFDGLPRDTTPDIGAYEWRASTATPTASPTPTRTASDCMVDANSNNVGDVVDIMTMVIKPGCLTYLSTLTARWHQPWITPTPSATPETRSDGATRLTTPPDGASDQNPAFSPDGTHLIFTRFENGYNDGPAGLFLLDLSTRQSTRLTPWEDQDNVNLPGSAWNAASDRIVFASDRAEANDLWRIAPNGTDFSRITTHTSLAGYIEPSWSPDGLWIVFEVSRPGLSEDGRVGKIWKVRADGTEATKLAGTAGFDSRQPNWSPTGTRILFQRRVLPAGLWDIYTMAVDGSDLRNVTNDPTADDSDASWSPDGHWVVYSSDDGGLPRPNIFVIPTAGGTPIRVTHDLAGADGAPSWSPDGKWIVFESHTDDHAPAALWQIAVPTLEAARH